MKRLSSNPIKELIEHCNGHREKVSVHLVWI